MRQEIRLARTELGEKAATVSKRLTSVIAGGVVAYVGALALVAGIILLLTQVVGIPAWLSALLVGVAMPIAGSVTLRAGLRALQTIDPAPRRTVETLKDDVRWAKEMRQ